MLIAILALILGAPGCRNQADNPDGEYECQHGSVCRKYDTPIASGFMCDCLPGSFGRSCEYCVQGFVPINNKCVSSSCVLDGVTECGGAGQCVYSPDSNSWACSCQSGFTNIHGVCVSQVCITDTDGQSRVCGGRGACERLPGGTSSDDYSCRCSTLYIGDKCENCNPRTSKTVTSDGVTECVAFECFTDLNDSMPCGGNGRCVGRPSIEQSKGIVYSCECNFGYEFVWNRCAPSTCVFIYMGEARVCGYDDKFQELCVKKGSGDDWGCKCPPEAEFISGYGCTSKQCVSGSDVVPCSGVGVCHLFSESNGGVYKCACPSFTAGDFCESCDPSLSTKIDGVCVPHDCIYGGVACNNHGTCSSFGWHHFCECDPGYDIVIQGRHYCSLDECHDRNTNLLCSGAGTCDESTRVCQCNKDFQYVPYGMCVPKDLIFNSKVCNGNGYARLKTSEEGVTNPDPTNPANWVCECTTLYNGSDCSECNSKTSFAPTGTSTCVSRDCYSDGYKLADNTSNYIEQPTELCTFPMPSPGTLRAAALGVCSQYSFADRDIFACAPTDKEKYQQGYNHSSIYPISCTFPGKYYTYTNFVCGLLENRTAPMELHQNLCIRKPESTEDDYICRCSRGYTLIEQTIDSKVRYTCMHSSCLNPGTSEGSTNINDYCNGLGDCVVNPLNPLDYHCLCGKGSRLIDGSCVSKACISEERENGTPVVCGGRGTCVLQDGKWGCQCMDSSKYIYVASSCYPRACVYMQENSDGDTYVQLCGGDETAPGGTCHVDTSNPDSSYCSCNEDFAKFGSTCVNKQCVSVDIQNNFQVTKDSICSGAGYCLHYPRGNRAQCICKAGSGTSIGPFCTSRECVTLENFQHNGIMEIIYLNCGRPGAGVCKDNECICNDGYEILAQHPKICVNTGCVDNEVYCGGDLGATCIMGEVSASCACSSAFVAVNNTCVPLACYSQNSMGSDTVCGGPGIGECVKEPSTEEYKCKCTNGQYASAKMWYNGYMVWTCAPRACVNGSDDDARVCGSPGGTCVQSGGQIRCQCADGFTLLYPTQCVSQDCISQDVEGNDAVCSGVGVCVENIEGSAITYSCGSCKNGFTTINGKCISNSCLFQIAPGVQKFYVCGKLGNLGTCVGTGQNFECSCLRSSFLVQKDNEAYCVPLDCSDSHKHPAECGSHGTCVRAGLIDFKCTCDSGYETIDNKHGHHYCVSAKCRTGTGSDEIVCNNHGKCRSDKCTCDPGYTDGSGTTSNDATARCTECAPGYKEYNSNKTSISEKSVCVLNNCGTKDLADDCGGSDVADSKPCQYDEKTHSYQCVCKPNYFPENGICKESKCTGEGVDDACGGPFFGTCNNNACTCLDNMIQVKAYLCVSPRCISNNSTKEICNGHGKCAYRHRFYGCACDAKYISANDGLCYMDTCFYDKEHLTPVVCDGHGNKCVSGNCDCNPPFQKIDGQDGCIHNDCIVNGIICGGKGVCRADSSYSRYMCVCSDGFILSSDGTCQPASCSGDGVTICGNSGTCELTENNTYICICDERSANYGNGCMPLTCFPYENPLYNLCGGNGNCNLSTKKCVCSSEAVLVQDMLCQPKSCISSMSPNYLCSDHGICSKKSKLCECFEGYEGSYCEQCADGYKMYNGVDEYKGSCFLTKCGEDNCGPSGSCLFDENSQIYSCQCLAGFYYNEALQSCRRCLLEHCSVCKEEVVCGVCEPGYYPSTKTGLCKRCDDDCLTCSGPESSHCLSCKPGEVHSVGTGPAKCVDDCKEDKDGCSSCGVKIMGSKYCSVCSNPQDFPLNGVCSLEQQPRASACAKVSNGQCTRCSGAYFLYEGGCYSTSRLPGSQVCKTSIAGSCIICADGFYKASNSQCLSCSDLMDGCTMCKDAACTACSKGYYPDNSAKRCVRCREPCKTCLDSDSCTSCEEGYFAQFLTDSMLNYGECRRCDDTSAKDGLAGVSRCRKCIVYSVGSVDKPTKVHCDEFFNLMSAGAIAGIIIAVLILVGVAGFCVWWFMVRNKKARRQRSGMSKYSRGPSDPDSTSLLSMDATTSLL